MTSVLRWWIVVGLMMLALALAGWGGLRTLRTQQSLAVWQQAGADRAAIRWQWWSGRVPAAMSRPSLPPPSAAWSSWWSAPLPGAAGPSWRTAASAWRAWVSDRARFTAAAKAALATRAEWDRTPPLNAPPWSTAMIQATPGWPGQQVMDLPTAAAAWSPTVLRWSQAATLLDQAATAHRLPAPAMVTVEAWQTATAGMASALADVAQSAQKVAGVQADVPAWSAANAAWLAARPAPPPTPWIALLTAALLAIAATGLAAISAMGEISRRRETEQSERARSQQDRRLVQLRQLGNILENGLQKIFQENRINTLGRWTVPTEGDLGVVFRRLNRLMDSRRHWIAGLADLQQGVQSRIQALRDRVAAWAHAQSDRTADAGPAMGSMARQAATQAGEAEQWADQAAEVAHIAKSAAESINAQRWRRQAARTTLLEAGQSLKATGEDMGLLARTPAALRASVQQQRVLWLNAAVEASSPSPGNAVLLLADEGQRGADLVVETVEELAAQAQAMQQALRDVALRVETAMDALWKVEDQDAAPDANGLVDGLEEMMERMSASLSQWHERSRALAVALAAREQREREGVANEAAAWLQDIQDILVTWGRMARRLRDQDNQEDNGE